MKRILFLVFLFAASVLQAAEFEVVDQFTVDGATILRSSVQVIAPNADIPLLLWVSTSPTTPHLYVSTSGNVGIWTNSPESKLEINGTSKFNGIINTNNQWISGDGGAEGIYIKDDGNVGIGTTAPDNKLHVANSDALASSHSAAVITAEMNNNMVGLQLLTPADKQASIYFGDPDLDSQGRITFDHSLGTLNFATEPGAFQFVLNQSGNVGIGTASPGADLDIYGTSADLSIGNTDSDYTALRLLGSDTSDWAYIQAGTGGSDTTANLRITRRSTIDANINQFYIYSDTSYISGNVGIGTTSPGTDVIGTTDLTTGKVLDVRSSSGAADIYVNGDPARIGIIDSSGSSDDKWSVLETNGGGLLNFIPLLMAEQCGLTIFWLWI